MKAVRMTGGYKLLIVALTLVSASCGSDNTSSTTGNDSDGNRGPAGGQAVAWQEVTESRACVIAGCPAGQGFSIDSQGRFSSGRGASGSLASEELTTLVTAANPVAAQAFSIQACDEMPAEAGVEVSLTKNDPAASGSSGASGTAGSVSVVYQAPSGNLLCHRGDAAQVATLKSTIDVLAQKYDIAPGPSGGSGGGTDASCLNKPENAVCDGGCQPCTAGCTRTEGMSCSSGRCVPTQFDCALPR